MVLDGLRLDDAGIVDCRTQQGASGLRGQQNFTTVGLKHAAVAHQCVDGALVHLDVEQAVTGHIERDGVAGGQRDRAQPRVDRAFIGNVGAQ